MNNFPGMDEVIEFLRQQKAGTAPSRQLPTPPTALDIESNMRRFPRTAAVGEGVFAPIEASGGAGNVIKSLGGNALKFAARPDVIGATMAGRSLGNGLANWSKDMGDVNKARQAQIQSNFGGHLPSLAQLGYGDETVVSQPAPEPTRGKPESAARSSAVAQSMKLAGIPSEETDESFDNPIEERQEVSPEVSQEGDPRASLDVASTGPVSSSVSTQGAQPSEDDVFLQHIFDTIGQQKAPMQETVNPASAQAVAEAGKDKVQKKETTGHKIKRFLVAGSGPLDFSRIDKQEADANQAQQAFTDPQKFKAEVAAKDVQGAQQFNRESQLQADRTQGMTPQMKFMLDLLGDKSKMNMEQGFRKENLSTEHKNRLGEIEASGANQKLTPEALAAQTGMSMMDKYPDLFSPALIKQRTGLDVSPEALKSLTDARLKNDPMAMMVTEMLKDRMAGMKSKTSGATITTNALSGKK